MHHSTEFIFSLKLIFFCWITRFNRNPALLGKIWYCTLPAKWVRPVYVVDSFATKLAMFPFASFTSTCLHEDCNANLDSVRFWLRCTEATLRVFCHVPEIQHSQELLKRCATKKMPRVFLNRLFLVKSILYMIGNAPSPLGLGTLESRTLTTADERENVRVRCHFISCEALATDCDYS